MLVLVQHSRGDELKALDRAVGDYELVGLDRIWRRIDSGENGYWVTDMTFESGTSKLLSSISASIDRF